MGKIILFAKAESERARRLPRTAGEVVIFPGVRVEYHDRPPSPPVSDPPPRTKRRRARKALSA